MRILVVEDNRDAAHSLRDVLELHGHTVAVAYDGEAGIEVARWFQPDTVVCDIGLPIVDGYTVARELRMGVAGKPPRLVAYTAYGGSEERSRALAAGFDQLLVKPAEPSALVKILTGERDPVNTRF